MINSFKTLAISPPEQKPGSPDPALCLIEFSKMLYQLGLKHEAGGISLPSELLSWKLDTNNLYNNLFHDLQCQLEYLIGCYPGKIINMTSEVTAERDIDCFITQDLQGGFHLILKKHEPSSEPCYEIHENGVRPYYRHTPFLTRLKHFLTQVPAHLKHIDSIDLDYFLNIFSFIENIVASIELNDTRWLENHNGLKLGIRRMTDGSCQAILDMGKANERYIRVDTPDKVVLIHHQE